MLLTCDVCGFKYETDFNNHEIGEPNWCCSACAWECSHSLDEPKPPHTCGKNTRIGMRRMRGK